MLIEIMKLNSVFQRNQIYIFKDIYVLWLIRFLSDKNYEKYTQEREKNIYGNLLI